MNSEDLISISSSYNIYNNDFINNLNNYALFLKERLFINDYELKYIIYLTINNKKNKILYNIKDYSKNKSYYHKKFIEMFMYNYNQNIKFLNKIMYIDKRDFNSLINNINKHKKRIYSYFEQIDQTNINFYLPIILSLEEFSS